MSHRGQQILLELLLAALLLFLLRIAWPFASSFVLASMLATVMHPANSRLSRRLRRPGLACLLTTLATVIVLTRRMPTSVPCTLAARTSSYRSW